MTTSSNIMDNKYGHIFTEGDVLKILEYVVKEADLATPESASEEAANWFTDVMEEDIRFKFPAEEPLFILRGRDRRAIGAVMHYRDHQASNAPDNHVEAIQRAFTAFDTYREENPGQMREPD